MIVTISLCDRAYSETIDIAELREHFDEAEFPGGKPAWEHYTRPLLTDDKGLKQLSGNHFLPGWLEGIWQSDRSPLFCLIEGNPATEFLYHVFGE